MNSKRYIVKTLKNGGKVVSASTMTALQALRHVTSSEPRRLTASEIALLRQSKKEVGDRVRELLRAG